MPQNSMGKIAPVFKGKYIECKFYRYTKCSVVSKSKLNVSHVKQSKQLAISQSPGPSRAISMLEGQEIWQHTFKLNV
jgi:hypothetical protein